MNDTGFWIEQDVLSSQKCEELLAALSRDERQRVERQRSRAGARHLMSHSAVAAIAGDQRLISIAQRALGAGAVPYRATLFEKTGPANWLVVWHQDTALPLVSRFDAADWGPWSCKAGIHYAHAPAWALERILALRIHLDASTSENGPLRVLPGSHTRGVMSDEEVFALAAAHQHVECLVSRGGVMAMRPLLVHSSGKSQTDAPRRVLHVEYAESLDLARGIRLEVA